jgi:hypothetical protein
VVVIYFFERSCLIYRSMEQHKDRCSKACLRLDSSLYAVYKFPKIIISSPLEFIEKLVFPDYLDSIRSNISKDCCVLIVDLAVGIDFFPFWLLLRVSMASELVHFALVQVLIDYSGYSRER